MSTPREPSARTPQKRPRASSIKPAPAAALPTLAAANLPRLRPLTVAGIMSGTSADGIDVAIVRITPRPAHSRQGSPAQAQAKPNADLIEATDADQNADLDLKLDLLHHAAFPFPKALRNAVIEAAGTGETTTAALGRLHWRLGLAYADAARTALTRASTRVDLIGCHGQTIYHQGRPSIHLGEKFACTWQIGEPALLAHALGIPVVSNFRPADMAHSGQGAPLVSLLDYVLFRHPRRARVLQNIGGIGNLTVVAAAAPLSAVRAFDTGPGNMIIDALMQQLYRRPYDRGGRVASTGQVLTPVVDRALQAPYFRKAPPKSAGREQFGAPYSAALLSYCRRLSSHPADAIATATALTAESIALAFQRFVLASVTSAPVDYFISGGGAKNATLLSMLRLKLAPLGCTVATTDSAALPVEAKEAAAFALLAYQTWHHRPGNVPSATGASAPAILGQVCYA